jgi:hypothetical protein
MSAPDPQPQRCAACDVCGRESAVWGPNLQRCADHFAFGHHQPPPPDPLPRERVLELFAKARASGRLRP